METQFITSKLTEKFSTLLELEIPLETPMNDELEDDCARLYFDGVETDSKNLRRSYKYRLRYYGENWCKTTNGIDKAENYIRSSAPEVFSNEENKFYVRYLNVNTIHENLYTTSGVMYCYTEVQFSVMI